MVLNIETVYLTRRLLQRVIADRQFKQIIEDIFDLSRDVRLLIRILVSISSE